MASTPSRKSTVKKSGSTRRSSSRTRSTSSTRKPKTVNRRKPSPPPRAPISPQQRVAIVGIAMIVVGVLLLLSLLTSASGSVTGWITRTLTHALGWGAYILPIAFLLLGLWFLLSKMEHFPNLSTERLIGSVLFFFNLVTWFQLFTSSTTKPAGGGKIGQLLMNGLVTALGKPGTVIVLAAWLLTALVLLINLSMSDLIYWLAERFKSRQSAFADFIRRKAEEQRASAQDEPVSQVSQAVAASQASLPSPEVKPVDTMSAPRVTLGQTSGKTHTWHLPDPIQVLNPVEAAPSDQESDEDRARVIEETLRSFSTPGHVVEIRRGPTITMFGVEPDFVESRTGRTRVRVGNIVRLSDDLAMALRASRIRIQAPVPGKGYVGIEVPNQKTALVSLLEIVESPSFISKRSLMKFALGKDVSGTPYTADLAGMPHLLIAGTTGSGKSVCINAILAGYLLTLTPDQLRLVLVDPKRVELTGYNGIPHLLAPVIVDAEKVVGALQWMLREMDLRYRIFSQNGTRNIDEYNEKVKREGGKHLPYILVVIDELADLMMLAPDETEKSLTRLAQLARATGIHLIIATQRPSTDILTGLIKANFPARIAFAVASNTDSRVILDQPGAERLLGRGDMLFQPPDAPAPIRLQGTYVSDQEINRLTDFWREQAQDGNASQSPDTTLLSGQQGTPFTQGPLWAEMEKDPDEDPIQKEAIAIIRKEGRASISMLQRKLRIGYTRSARLVEKLEEFGIIGPPDPQTGTREVLDWGEYPPLNED